MSNSPADFSPDGLQLLFIVGWGPEFKSLRVFDIVTSTAKTIVEDKWDVLGAVIQKAEST